MFEAAIFDWDGTLADTRKAIVASFHRSLKEVAGLDVSTEYVERRIGIGASETFREILQAKKGTVNEALVKRLVERKSEVQISMAEQVQLFPGGVELLSLLQGKTKVGLASMNNRAVIEHLLQEKELASCFEVVVTAEQVSHSKPDPEIFLEAAKQLRANPTRSVVFEDSIFGVEAAKSAQMTCVAVTTGVYSMEELKKEKPDLVVKTLADPKLAPFVLS